MRQAAAAWRVMRPSVELGRSRDVGAKPGRQFFSSKLARRQVEHQTLLFVDGGFNRVPVQIEEDGHRRMGDPLVAIDERMVQRQTEPERAGLVDEARIEIRTSERGLGLSHG